MPFGKAGGECKRREKGTSLNSRREEEVVGGCLAGQERGREGGLGGMGG